MPPPREGKDALSPRSRAYLEGRGSYDPMELLRDRLAGMFGLEGRTMWAGPGQGGWLGRGGTTTPIGATPAGGADEREKLSLLADYLRERLALQREANQAGSPQAQYEAEARYADPVAYANKMASLPSYMPGSQSPFATGYFQQPSSFGFSPQQVAATRDLGSVTPAERAATASLGAADAWRKIFGMRGTT
jgi:hypothetical protein